MAPSQMLKNKKILLTGGTGSFGKAFIARVLKEYPGVKQLLVFSRDELKQFELRQQYPEKQFPALRFMLGDVRDRERVQEAMEGMDYVIHAAALKHAPWRRLTLWSLSRPMSTAPSMWYRLP